MTAPTAALSAAELPHITGCRTPSYDRSAAVPGVVHVGLGAFARAHVARYCDDLLGLDGGSPAVIGTSLRSGSTTRALVPQDGLYTLVETDGRRRESRIVGSVTRLAHGAAATIDAIAAEATTAVTMTITEKGYHHAPGRGRLDLDDPAVTHDVSHPDEPRTAAGVLVAALRRRRDAGRRGLAIVSCDNLPANGAVTAAVVADLAAATEPDLAAWIAAHVAFPSTVVDRIVPAPTDGDRRFVAERLGLRDAAPVLAETHCSWVIEATPGLPAWHRVGARVVHDVTPWQQRKLRLVNAPHSALAYLGALAGHATIDAAATDPALARFVAALATQEIVPTLMPIDGGSGEDEGADITTTLARFANPALGHRTRQVAADGSQKLRPRILDTIADRRATDGSVDRLALVVAAWMAWVAQSTRGGHRLDDPLAGQLTATVQAAGTRPADLAAALLDTPAVVDPDVAADPAVRTAVTRALSLIDRRGAAAAVRALT